MGSITQFVFHEVVIRKWGNSGFEVAFIVFGCFQLCSIFAVCLFKFTYVQNVNNEEHEDKNVWFFTYIILLIKIDTDLRLKIIYLNEIFESNHGSSSFPLNSSTYWPASWVWSSRYSFHSPMYAILRRISFLILSKIFSSSFLFLRAWFNAVCSFARSSLQAFASS